MYNLRNELIILGLTSYYSWADVILFLVDLISYPLVRLSSYSLYSTHGVFIYILGSCWFLWIAELVKCYSIVKENTTIE